MDFDPHKLFEEMAQEAGHVYCPACSSPHWKVWHPPGKHTKEGVIDVEKSVEPKAIEGLTEGRIVHCVIGENEHRPAIVVKVWDHGTGCSNLQVFSDGTKASENSVGLVTSWLYSENQEPGTWHWIEKA